MSHPTRFGASPCSVVPAGDETGSAIEPELTVLPEIEFSKQTLANGLDVILHEDHKLPFVCVNLWYHVGSKNERPGRTGFAHLFEHMMFQGSKNSPVDHISAVERLGANLRAGGVNGTTSWDRTNYFETVPSPALERALWMEADRMAHLLDALTQDKLDNQRDVVKNERRQGVDNVPYGRMREIAFSSIFPAGHPYSWPIIGYMEDIDAASLEDVSDFFRRFYTPNNCSLAIAGDIDPQRTVQMVERHFGSIAPGPPLERRKRWVTHLDDERLIVVRDQVPQERVYLMYVAEPAFAASEAPLDVLAQVLSSGKNSRLFKNLVYDKQIASDASASNAALEMAGVFMVMATARPDADLGDVQRALEVELGRLARQGPEEDELERAKADLEFDYLSGLQRIGGIGGKADILNRYNTFLGNPGHFKQDYERYQEVTSEDVRRVAERYLTGVGRLVMHYLPESGTPSTPVEVDRAEGPAIGPRKSFDVPQIEVGAISSGVRVMVVNRPELPLISSALFIEGGARYDPIGLPGLAWMTAVMLDEGTTSRDSLEIAAELHRLGSHLTTTAGYDGSWVSVQTLLRNLRPTMAIAADLVMHPTFPEKELERLRKRRLDGLLQERTEARGIADRVFRERLYGTEHPYGHPRRGNEASIKSMSQIDLGQCYESLWSPSAATMVFAGNIAMDEAIDVTQEAFGSWAHRQQATPPQCPPLEKIESNRVVLVARPSSAQTVLRLGLPGPARNTPDYAAIELMKTILGGSFSSRLNLNLREDKGYTYGARAGVRYARECGHVVAAAGVESKVTADAVREFFVELRGIIGDKPITGTELEQAKDNLIRGYAQNFESLSSLVGQVGERVTLGLSIDEMSTFSERVEAATLDDVQRVTSALIDPDRLWIIAVGDPDTIAEPLRRLDIGEVEIVDVEGQPA